MKGTMKRHQMVIWMIFAALYIFGVSTAQGQRQPGRGRRPAELPYAPLTGTIIEQNVYYSILVVKADDAPANPRLESGRLVINLWRERNGRWCDADNIVATDQEQPISAFLFQPGDTLALEQWQGYTFVIRGYDGKGGRVSETRMSGGPSEHHQIAVRIGCS